MIESENVKGALKEVRDMYSVRRFGLLLGTYILGILTGVHGGKIALILIGVPVVAMWLMSLDSVKYKKMKRGN